MTPLIISEPVSFALYLALPWFLGAFLLVSVNLYQHAGCNPENIYEGSRNFVSPIENWFFFNNGYHTAHHLIPNKHWSELANYHAEVCKDIPPVLNQKSILIFLIKNAIPGSSKEKKAHAFT